MQFLPSTLEAATRAAGALIKQRMGSSFSVMAKAGHNDWVTSIDKLCESTIISIIQQRYPQHSILSEEAGSISGDPAFEWIIDPIDGTMNFLHGIPLCTASVALKIEGQVCMGAVYHPFLDEFFWAEKGKGAFLNGQPIRVNDTTKLANSCLVTGFSHNGVAEADYVQMFGVFQRLVKEGIPLRRLGAASLNMAWVAAGRMGVYYQFSTLNLWDIAASALLLEEAGGKITNLHNEPFDINCPGMVASNTFLHEELCQLIKQVN